jgi:phage-related protein
MTASGGKLLFVTVYNKSVAVTLLESNPYLSDPAVRAKLIRLSVTYSTAIEGVHLKSSDLRPDKRTKSRVRPRRSSGRSGGSRRRKLFFWVPTGPSLVRWSHLCDTLVQMLNVLKQCRRELDDLPDEVKGDLADAVARLDMGHVLSMPLSRPMPSIGRGVHELRLRDSSGIYRVIYYLAGSNAIHLLHAFMKKKSQTPQQNIEIAKKRLREVTK